jgi:hypothetical protein
MIELADPLGKVAIPFEVLGQSDDVRQCFPEVGREIPHLCGVGPRSSEDATSRGGAEGLLAISAAEYYAGSGDAIDIWTVDVLGAVAT